MTKAANLLENVLNCYVCNYFTCNRRDYERHIKTKRHIAKTQAIKEKEPKCEFVRMNATDEADDFTPKTVSLSFDTQDSVENIKKSGKKLKTRGTQLPKKTSSGENIVITHIELDDTDVEQEIIKVNIDGVTNDEPIYETIYTNPIVARKYIPGVFDMILNIGTMIHTFFIDIIRSNTKAIRQDLKPLYD